MPPEVYCLHAFTGACPLASRETTHRLPAAFAAELNVRVQRLRHAGAERGDWACMEPYKRPVKPQIRLRCLQVCSSAFRLEAVIVRMSPLTGFQKSVPEIYDLRIRQELQLVNQRGLHNPVGQKPDFLSVVVLQTAGGAHDERECPRPF